MTARLGRWCDHVAPATALVPCSGEQHRITWRRGKVVLEAHDLTAEETMLAFGGQPCACVQALRLWRNLHSWSMSGQLFQQMTARLGADTVLAPGALGAVHELGLLLTWERMWRRSAYFSDHERLLREQLLKRAVDPLRRHVAYWKNRVGSRRTPVVDVQAQRPGRPGLLSGSMDAVGGRVTASLGTAWVLRVWARGLAVVDGAFVVEMVDDVSEPDSPEVRAARWEEQGADVHTAVVRPARVRSAGEGWDLTWSEDPPM